jgi:cytochrome P450
VSHQPANQPPTPKIAPELLIDFDFFAVKAIDGDLHRGWKQLHAGPDIFYTPRNGGHWVYTRAEDIAAAWHAPERYSNSGVAMTREEREMKLYPGEADPPEHTHYRALTEDFTYKGLPMRSGDLVLLPAALHNLDDRKYADPMTVDFGRAIKNHMGFGTGIHRCLGAQLARVELRVMLQEWLPCIPEFRIANEAGVVFKSGRINSVHNLPLMWSH